MWVVCTAVQKDAQTCSATNNLLFAPPLQVYDEHQELTPDTILTHFLFSLPVDAPLPLLLSLSPCAGSCDLSSPLPTSPAVRGWAA